MVSSLPKAAARCNGVSDLVRQSRMKAPVSTDGLVVRFGSAPLPSRTLTTKICGGRGEDKSACRGGFAGIEQRQVHVRAVLDEELAEPPVPVEGGGVEAKIVSQRLQRFAIRK